MKKRYLGLGIKIPCREFTRRILDGRGNASEKRECVVSTVQ